LAVPGYLDKGHPLYNQAEAQAFGQIIPDNYRYMDSILGKTLERGDKDTLIIVLLRSWFTSFRWTIHLNTWLETVHLTAGVSLTAQDMQYGFK
jgi:hypothetical protein